MAGVAELGVRPETSPTAFLLILALVVSIGWLAVRLGRTDGRSSPSGRLRALWLRVSFEDPRAVDRLLLRGTLAGAMGGALGALVSQLVHQRVDGAEAVRVVWNTPTPGVFAIVFSAALLLLALPRGHGVGTLLALVHAGALLPLLPWTSATLPFLFTAPLGLVLALEQPSTPRRLAALIGPSLGGAWCLQLAQWLSAGPESSLSWVFEIASGLFLSAGAALAWISFAPDDIEPKLAGQSRLTWRRLRAALRRLPEGEPRASLETMARECADRYASAQTEREEVARSLNAPLERQGRDAVQALRQRLAEDPEREPHLAQVLRLHQDTLEQLDGLHRQLDRLDVRAAAEAGWLETAALAVERAPTGPDLDALATRLRPCIVSNRF